MLNAFSRTELLLGSKAMKKLAGSKVEVFGIGGVGTFAVEALARAGVGGLVLVDGDRICLTNINRQIHATHKTVGLFKADVMGERVLEINPGADVTVHKVFYTPENAMQLIDKEADYIIDAVDTMTAKIDLVVRAKELGIPVISCMGAGNKLDPTRFEVADIYATSVCPVAKVMRRELRQRGVGSLKVVYSQEQPLETVGDEQNSCRRNCICPADTERTCTIRRAIPGSVSFVPSAAGLILAGEVIKDIVGAGSLR